MCLVLMKNQIWRKVKCRLIITQCRLGSEFQRIFKVLELWILTSGTNALVQIIGIKGINRRCFYNYIRSLLRQQKILNSHPSPRNLSFKVVLDFTVLDLQIPRIYRVRLFWLF
jgi:hypothetical protein